jgi:predicted Ser/Thr protein kinase
MHPYAMYIPLEVQKVVEMENSALAKEIDDQRNEKTIKEIREMYLKRYGEMKSEFDTNVTNVQFLLKCF